MRVHIRRTARCAVSTVVLAALTACGGSGGVPGTPVAPPPPATYAVGGTVTGLSGSGLVLQDNGADDLPVTASSFTFATGLTTGSAYAVTVKTQPSAPAQNCVVQNGSGTIGTADAAVTVSCSGAAMVSLGGTVTGLTGSGLVLDYYYDAAGSPPVQLAVSATGAFTFPTDVAQGSSYQVAVGTQPASPTQNCVVTNGSGVVGTAEVANIEVACAGVGRFAYVSNGGDNTISAYAIDPTTGALTPVGAAVPTGTSPYAIVGSPDRRHVYVVNETGNSISAYSVDAASGALTEITGSPYPAGAEPRALAFDPTGSYLYVANSGSNSLSAYAVNSSTGALAPLTTSAYAAGLGPSAVSIDRAGKFVFVANSGGSNDISVFAIAAGTGELTPAIGSPFAAGGDPADNPRSLVFVDSGGLYGIYGLYVSTSNPLAGSSVSEFTIDSVTGTLTLQTAWVVAVDNYLATDRNGDFLYGATGGGVVGYRLIDGGSLFTLSGYPYASGTNAYSVTVDPSNQFLYVANDGAGTVSGFQRLLHGGLAAMPGSPFTAGRRPDFMAII